MENATQLVSFPIEGQSLRASWPIWKLAVLDLLEATTSTPHGLLSHAMPEAAYILLTGDAAAPVPPVDPGPPPNNATVAQTAANKYANELFDRHQRALKLCKTQILASLNAEALDLLTEPTHGTRRRTILDIMTMLEAQYGQLMATDLAQQKNILLIPFQPPKPIRDYIRKHREVHRICEAAGQPLSQADTVAALRLGVRNVPYLATAVQHFVTAHPTVQAQTFPLLATLLGQAEDNGEPQPTTGSAGYAGASVTEPPVALTMSNVQDMIAAAVTAALQTRPKTTAGRPKGTPLYCWSHGPCAHASQDCKKPRPGHIATATDKDRQGGASVNPRYQTS